MTSKEIANAMANKTPVLYQGTIYPRIKEYIFWYDEHDERKTSVVLIDPNKNSTIRVLTSQIHIVNEFTNDE